MYRLQRLHGNWIASLADKSLFVVVDTLAEAIAWIEADKEGRDEHTGNLHPLRS